MNCRFCWPTLILLGVAAACLPAADPKDEPIRPDKTIVLCNGKDLTGLHTWLKGSQRDDPKKVFTVHDGMIHASGEDNGYVSTDKEYQDYYLTVEYKWGQRTDGGKFVRNSGLLLNAVGPDGGANGTWMSSVECQLAQGCAGDLIVIRGKDEKGETIPVRLSSDVVIGPDKRPRWSSEGGKRQEFTNRQLWWNKHDPDFKELLDTRGRHDVESPLGEWTKIEVVADGARLSVFVNGKQVNEAYDLSPASGKILLQCEGFEVFFRKFELRPLKKAEEKK